MKTNEPFAEQSDNPGGFYTTVLSAFGTSPETWCDVRRGTLGDQKVAQATRFLELLYGAYSAGFVEIRTGFIAQKPKMNITQKWFDLKAPGWIGELLGWAFSEEFLGKEVWIGVLPREIRSGLASSVKEAACFWADCDFKSTTAAAVKAAGGNTADLIVKSGGGLHLYWLIDQPIPLEGNTAAQFKQKLKKLQAKVGSDPVSNFDRILRLPGTTNFKEERKLEGVSPRVELVMWPGKVVTEPKKYEQAKLLDVAPRDDKAAAQAAGLKEAFN